MELIQKEALEAKVLLVPGASFFCDESPSPYVRASFSTGLFFCFFVFFCFFLFFVCFFVF